MKRTLITFVMAATLVMSCKKEDTPQPISDAVNLTKISHSDQGVAPGNVFLGEYKVSVGVVPYPLTFHFSIGGTVAVSQLRNFSASILRLPDSSNAVRIDPLQNFSSQIDLNGVSLPSGVYVVQLNATALPATIGTVFVETQISWVDDAGAIHYSASVKTQTTSISPYPGYVSIRSYERSGTLVDSEYVEYGMVITNHSSVPVGVPQYAYQLNLNDVDGNDTLTAYKQEVYENGVDVSSGIIVLDATGVLTTLFGEGLRTMFVVHTTGAREVEIPPHDSLDVVLRVYVGGLHHDGNNFSVRGMQDAVHLLQPYYFLNQASPGRNLKLTTTQTGGSSVSVYMPFSFKTGTAYSASPGNSSKSFTAGMMGTIDPMYYNQ